MNRGKPEDTTIYNVVVNHEEQYSIWPAGKENALGWREVGKTGLKNECLSYIKGKWNDMRPLSLRNKIDEISHGANDTQLDYTKGACIHHLFEAQVERAPNAVAAVFENQQLTYKELNRKANQLASHLKRFSVGPESKVGICMTRSIEMVVGILGILKAGGAFIPLDPVYPKDRLSFMIQETQIPVVLTQESLLKELPEHRARVVCLDTDWPSISQQSEENTKSMASELSLAYVIYTSGSTGMPKGVMVMHVSLWHYVQDLQVSLGITSADVYLHTASIAFSSSVRQLLVPLSLGATAVIATQEQKTNPLELFELIKRRDVTVMDIVPTFLRNCIHTLTRIKRLPREDLLDNRLRLILSTGEPLSYEVVNKWRFKCKHDARLINMYGATETSGSVAVHPIVYENGDRTKIAPLGRPIAHTHIYLLGRNLQPVSDGASGGLYIAGLRVARGYLNRPRLTAETFIPDSFSNVPGARLWKSGDLAHYLPHGNIGFIGRIDYQINLRGIRIEPEEIESVLADHPAVQQAVVVAKEDDHGENFLLAYLACDMKNIPDASSLRGFVRNKLPDHMIPSSFVMLDALPLTSSGKVDRQALPAFHTTRPHLKNPFIEPRTPVEEALVEIWSDVLCIDRIGIHDNFLELGGNSLLGTRVVSHIRDSFLLDLPLRSVFENPTVAELAMVITQRKAEKAEQKDIDHILAQLEMLSDEEAQGLLSDKTAMHEKGGSYE